MVRPVRLFLATLLVCAAAGALVVALACPWCEGEPGSCADAIEADGDARPTFRAGYESGLDAWDELQRTEPDRIRPVSSPVAEGRFAARFETRPSDSIGETDPRSEAFARVGAVEGEEQYYRWFTFFPEDFPTDPREFVTFTQWRAVDERDSFTSFMVWGDRIEMRRDGTRWSAPLERGRWHEFVYHVRWSPDPDVGFVELCHDGRLVLPRLSMRTMGGRPGEGVENYLKQGLYKSPRLATGVIYHDGLEVGASLEAVSGGSRQRP